MATTEIHAITGTPEKAISYVMADKTVEITTEDEIHKDCPYRVFEDGGKKYVSYTTLVSACNGCSLANPAQTMKDFRDRFEAKRSGTQAKDGKEPLLWHSHQSFNGREVSPELANEIGRKFAEEVFKGFPCIVTTHTNGDNIHNHFMFSAWNDEGKKWNNCNANYRLIRKVSDRLCDEYGLSVLEQTRDVKLVKYKDDAGQTRYYEPTDRKNDLIRQREQGTITADDVNSYRNTPQYEQTQKKELTNREIVKRDIDNLLPSCRSYDELIRRLRELGYIVKDKKKNGDWLAHITFQPPMGEKGLRDNSIGDGLYYTRLNLTAVIEQQKENLIAEEPPVSLTTHREDEPQKEDTTVAIPYYEEYRYGTTDLAKINDDFRKVKTDEGRFQIVPRRENEKRVLSDIRRMDSRVSGLIDTTHLHQLITEQETRKKQKKPYLSEREEQRLVAQIQQSFQCLRYTEKHDLYSYGQMLDMYKANRELFNRISAQRAQAAKLLNTMREVAKAPRIAASVSERMERMKDDEVYKLDQLLDDKEQLARCNALMKKYGLETEQGQAAFAEKIQAYTARLDDADNAIQNAALQMEEIENCIRTYDRLDRQRGMSNADFMRRFENIAAGLEDDAPDDAERREAEDERSDSKKKERDRE